MGYETDISKSIDTIVDEIFSINFKDEKIKEEILKISLKISVFESIDYEDTFDRYKNDLILFLENNYDVKIEDKDFFQNSHQIIELIKELNNDLEPDFSMS